MWAKHPDIAQRWTDEGKGYVKKGKRVVKLKRKFVAKPGMTGKEMRAMAKGKKPMMTEEMMMKKGKKKYKKSKKNWIAGAIKHPGALHRELGVKQGEKIPAGRLRAATKKPGLEGKRARLAETLKGLHHKRGKK